MNFTVKRIADTPYGCFGVLGEWKNNMMIPFAVTLEPPWLNNEPNISCIPSGVYLIKRVNSPKFGDVFEVTNVEDRENILFHWGNKLPNTKGCILTAEKFGILDGKPSVLTSHNSPGEGFNEFMDKLKGTNEAWVLFEWCVD